jgi:hypothetical protein
MPTFTQTQYDQLTAAIAIGALKVDYGDKKVEYRSLQEMLTLQNIMAQDLGIVTNQGQRRIADFKR